MGYAKIAIVGNLGRDPEMRYTPNGTPVTEFSVAVNQSTRAKDGTWSDDTDWYRCTVWGNRAERAAEQLRKGTKVLVDGRLKIRQYTTRDGRPGTSNDVSVETYVDLTPRARDGESDGGGAPEPAPSGGSAAPDRDLDDLPF